MGTIHEVCCWFPSTALSAAELHSLFTIVVRASSVLSASCLARLQPLQQIERDLHGGNTHGLRRLWDSAPSCQPANFSEGGTLLSSGYSKTVECLLQERDVRCHDEKLGM